VLSFKQANHWRRFAAESSGLAPGGRGLDVACGTGLLTLELARLAGSSGRVVGVDFCLEMLNRARKNVRRSPFRDIIRFELGNADALPFSDQSFDCVTMGFALRAVPDPERSIAELIRVVKPGGRVVTLELAKPSVPVFKEIYAVYLSRLVPLVGRLGVGRPGPYDFLARSVRAFRHQAEIRDLFVRAGLADVRYYELTGGIAAVHVGTRSLPA
jgi:demethylmenaquinone methyltransferase/2-methoxy-6-polyprenyl-1,4-benzoquinol methylase